MKSIRTKLLLIIIPILTISLIGISWFNHSKATEFLLQNFRDKSAVDLSNLRGDIDSWVQNQVARITTMASSDNVIRMDQQTLGYLKERQKEHPEFGTIMYAFPNGESWTTLDQKANITDRQYFKDIMGGKPLAISNVLISKVTKEPIIMIACPILNEAGQVKGVLGATISIKKMNEIVGKAKFAETGYAYLVQQDGTFIAHPDPNFLMKKKVQELNIPELSKAYQNIQEKANYGESRYTLDGVEKFSFYTDVPSTGWGLFISAPVKEATSQLDTLAKISFVTAAVVLIFAILVVVLFTSTLIKPIKMMSRLTSLVADGDLTIKLLHQSNDEVGVLGQNFNAMIEKMQGVLSAMKRTTEQTKRSSDTLVISSEETRSSAEQVARTITELASGTTDIAASVSQSTDQVQEMIQTVRELSSYADDIIGAAKQSKESAMDGRQYADESIKKMKEINQTVNQTAQIIGMLDHRSKEIGNIVGMITNIARQTNLLALNASIEAARAGDQGKGFAVVAEEVRKLANETSLSAEQISNLVRETQDESHRAVMAVEQGTKVVEEGMTAVQKAGTSFAEISCQIDDVLVKNVSIHGSIRDLEDQGSRVVRYMEDIAAVTEEAAAGSEQVSAASEQQAASASQISHDALAFAELAEELQVIIKQFKVHD
ncbi:methyl-accepting chemotaxis protein [Brevibacillus ginsengisoli]|uniref:methyl-accepting chemotaxis protein n=1 Tax=Brevibacillus ginsengisoli TaxID=363854 RepID=UPI003CF0DBBD